MKKTKIISFSIQHLMKYNPYGIIIMNNGHIFYHEM